MNNLFEKEDEYIAVHRNEDKKIVSVNNFDSLLSASGWAKSKLDGNDFDNVQILILTDGGAKLLTTYYVDDDLDILFR